MQEQMNIVIVGHVDHGKSTIIGRLLADTNSLPEGKLEQVRALCEFTSKPFEYSFLLDTLKDERSQGITIDSARIFFGTGRRDYIIIDAPGHIEFLKNMISGASRAEASLLVIDAAEGIKENSRRHGYMLSMLGIKQVAVAVNKMDLVNYSSSVFNRIKKEFGIFLREINILPKDFIPVSGRNGDNITYAGNKMPWYKGPSLVETFDNFKKENTLVAKPFRMTVQDIYKFTKGGDNRRIIAGYVETGKIKVGDEIVFHPSGKRCRIKTIEAFNKPRQDYVAAGSSTGITLEEEIYVRRGEIAVKTNDKGPNISADLKVSLFWLGSRPLVKGKEYVLKLGTAKVQIELIKIIKKINAQNLDSMVGSHSVERHGVAECVFRCSNNLVFDTVDNISVTSRFVIVDNYEIAGGGIILEAVNENSHAHFEKYFQKKFNGLKNGLLQKETDKKSAVLLFTGSGGTSLNGIIEQLETKLSATGRFACFLGTGNLLSGAAAKNNSESREKYLKILADISELMLDTDLLIVITAYGITGRDAEILNKITGQDRLSIIWSGPDKPSDLIPDLLLGEVNDSGVNADIVINTLLNNVGMLQI